MQWMPSKTFVDNSVFLLLSIFIVGSVLLGYRQFVIPPSHHVYISCGEQCKELVLESISQVKHSFKFGKQKQNVHLDETALQRSIFILEGPQLTNNQRQSNIPIGLQEFLLLTLYMVRSTFYNTLYLLSGFFGLPFHFFFSIFLSFLMIAGALLVEKLQSNIASATGGGGGRSFFLAAQLFPFFVTHGRLVVLSFSLILFFYLLSLSTERKNKPYNVLLHFVCLLCSSLSTGIFFIIYAFFVWQLIRRWNVLKAGNLAIFLLLALAFFPFFVGAFLKNSLYFNHDMLVLTKEHGSLFPIDGSSGRRNVRHISSLFLSCIPFISLLPRFRKTFNLPYDCHALYIVIGLAGIFCGPNFGRVLLLLNGLFLKVVLEKNFLKNLRGT